MKFENLYNLQSLQEFRASGTNLDGVWAQNPASNSLKFADSVAPGTILARQLEMLDPNILKAQYPDLSFLNAGIEADNTGGYGTSIKSLRNRAQGEFKESRDLDSNKGQITISGEESLISVYSREAETSWNDDEVKQAAMANEDLPKQFLEMVNEIYLREVDEIGLVGKDSIKSGLLDNSFFTTTPAANTAANLSGLELYNEISDLITLQNNKVNNTLAYKTKVVMMPISVMNICASKILNTAAGSMTVLTALRSNFSDVNFTSTFRAENVNGNSATVAYSNDNRAMKMRLPTPLTTSPVIQKGFKFHTAHKFRVAGLDILEPSSGSIKIGL